GRDRRPDRGSRGHAWRAPRPRRPGGVSEPGRAVRRARLPGLDGPQVRPLEPGARLPPAAGAAGGIRAAGAGPRWRRPRPPRRRGGEARLRRPRAVLRRSRLHGSAAGRPPLRVLRDRASGPHRPAARLSRAAPRRPPRRRSSPHRRGDLRRPRLGTGNGLCRGRRRGAQHGVLHAERGVDPDLTGGRRARLPSRYARADLLPRPAASERPRARQASAHDTHAHARPAQRRPGHGARDAGGRPAGSVDAPGVPEPGRVRHGGTGGDRGAPLLVGALPVELLPPQREAGRAARRRPHLGRRAGRPQRAGSPPRGRGRLGGGRRALHPRGRRAGRAACRGRSAWRSEPSHARVRARLVGAGLSSVLGKLALGVVSLALTVGVLEIGVRLAHLEVNDHANEMRKYGLVLVQDAAGYSRHRPGVSAVIQRVPMRFNSLGMRGEEPRSPKPPQTFRILCLGDSVTLGPGVAEEAIYPSRLGALLADGNTEVVAAGVGGWNTVEEERFLAANFPRLDPDLVVLLYVINGSDPIEPWRRAAQLPEGRRSRGGWCWIAACWNGRRSPPHASEGSTGTGSA